MIDLRLKFILDIFCLTLRLDYSLDVVNTFKDNTIKYLLDSKKNTSYMSDYRTIEEKLLHLIAFSHSSFERRLNRRLYDYLKEYGYI